MTGQSSAANLAPLNDFAAMDAAHGPALLPPVRSGGEPAEGRASPTSVPQRGPAPDPGEALLLSIRNDDEKRAPRPARSEITFSAVRSTCCRGRIGDIYGVRPSSESRRVNNASARRRISDNRAQRSNACAEDHDRLCVRPERLNSAAKEAAFV